MASWHLGTEKYRSVDHEMATTKFTDLRVPEGKFHAEPVEVEYHGRPGDIWTAAYHGHIGRVTELLMNGIDPSIRGPGDRSPLHVAARQKRVLVLQVLLQYGSNPNAISLRDAGNTPLHSACAGGNKKCIFALLKAGGNPLIRNRFGHTPAQRGPLFGHDNMEDEINAYAADFRDKVDSNWRRDMCAAAHDGDLPRLRILAKSTDESRERVEAGCTLTLHSDDEYLPLLCAVETSQVETVRYLLSLSLVDVNGVGRTPGGMHGSALHVACNANSEKLVQLLLEAGGDMHVQDEQGRIPLEVTTPAFQHVLELAFDISMLEFRCTNDRMAFRSEQRAKVKAEKEAEEARVEQARLDRLQAAADRRADRDRAEKEARALRSALWVGQKMGWSNTWHCVYCSYADNSILVPKCEACGKDRL